jgi:predicted DNA-binding protein
VEKLAPKTSYAKAYVIGRSAFAAITAVEGLKLSRESEERLQQTENLSSEERLAVIMQAVSRSR